MTLEEIADILQQCEEFVGYFGSTRADELLPQIEDARVLLVERPEYFSGLLLPSGMYGAVDDGNIPDTPYDEWCVNVETLLEECRIA